MIPALEDRRNAWGGLCAASACLVSDKNVDSKTDHEGKCGRTSLEMHQKPEVQTPQLITPHSYP